MAKDIDFQEYSAKYEDTDGDEHTSTVRAHQATKETADTLGTVATRTGSHDVRSGDVLVETEREGVYDIHNKDTWGKLGYSTGSAGKASAAPTGDNPTGTASGESGTDEDTEKSTPSASSRPRRS